MSNSDFDGDFIQSKKAIHPFLYQVSVHQVSITTKFISQNLCMYVVSTVVSRSQPHSLSLPEAGSFKDRLLGLRRMAVLLHNSSSCWEVTIDRDFCIISG